MALPEDLPNSRRVFVSYSRHDQGFARNLHRWLLDHGHQPWMDVFDIPAGSRWPDEIDRALRTSDIVLGIMSANALESPNVKNEWDWAIANGRRLVLARIEPCTIPFHYVSINYIDFTHGHDAALEMLARSLTPEPGTQSAISNEQYPAPAAQPGDSLGSSAKTTPVTSNIPHALSSIFGREGSIEEIGALLETTRLLTVVGPGGVGKTRLALAVAEAQSGRFRDGVFFVPLAPLDRPDLVAIEIVHAVGIQDAAGQTPVETIIGFLRNRSTFLVLDNFEHVVSASPIVTRLLDECPQLSVLATSRVPLRVRGEQEYPLRPLSDEAATALFIRRSREVRPDFDPDDDQMKSIVEICQRLDGLPLAIELAASRSKILPPQALLRRLERPLTVLTRNRRDLPAHQQTLRDTIAWSYDLLQTDEQTLFQTLAVFAGGWTLEAAETVGPQNIDILDGVERLAESSLIETYSHDGLEPRFQMLETIREFGLEKLDQSADANRVREQHARFFADYVATAMSHMYGPEQIEWLDKLEADHANLRAALDWFADHDNATGLKMVGPLWRFWWMRGYLEIGRHYYDMLLERADGQTMEPEMLGHALTGAGIMAEWQQDQERAISLQERALEIWRALPSPPDGAYWSFISLGNMACDRGDLKLGESLFREGYELSRSNDLTYGLLATGDGIGNVAATQGKYDLAEAYYRTTIEIGRELGDSWTIAVGMGQLGSLLIDLERNDEARVLLKESTILNRQMRHKRDIAWDLYRLGLIEIMDGYLGSAETLFEEGHSLALEISDPVGVANAKRGLATVARKRGDLDNARQLLMESLDATQITGEPHGTVGTIEGFAATFAEQGEHEMAARLLGFSATFREQSGIPLTPRERSEIAQVEASARDTLTHDAFEAASREGSAMTLEQIVTAIER